MPYLCIIILTQMFKLHLIKADKHHFNFLIILYGLHEDAYFTDLIILKLLTC